MSSPETAAPAAEAVNRLGMVISGRYLIRELLGEGGMGSVYLAEHTHMKKRVALKLLHPEMVDNAEVSARFEREAMAASHIVHPNVAAATDFGKTEDGAYFLVLEYVEGTSLRDALEEAPISVARCLRITRQIALALERAHEAGIVHRDLKPENVMLVKKDDEPDFVKVLDFGIAKLLDGAGPQASAELAMRQGANAHKVLTRMGTILGTPEYMAPEQALGEPVTPAADLYGVGVMLYEMLTGKHPFDPPDRMAMLSLHICAPVPLMQDRAPDREIPAMVEAVARCLLEKEGKKRYANARALIEAIDAAGAASGIDAGGIPTALPSKPAADERGTAAERAPGWTANDAFLQTSIGTAAPGDAGLSPGPSSVKLGDGASTGLLDKLGRQPRHVLFGLAAAIPLGFILLIVIAVIAFRAPTTTNGSSTTSGKNESPEIASGKAAPPERVKAAEALGPEAIEALMKEFPEDSSLQHNLAVAYGMAGKGAEAMRAVRALLAAKPSEAGDDEIARLLAATAANGQAGADDDAFSILEGPLGERGVDVLIDLAAKGAGQETKSVRARATKSLAKPEVRAHASAAASVLLDWKTARSCKAKRDLLDRAKESGDARLLPSLSALKPTRGCGFLGRRDCWSCLRKGSALEDAITAVEARPGPK